MDPAFLNVDLEITSKTSLSGLKREFGDRVFVLWSDKIRAEYQMSLELTAQPKDPDSTILAFCAMVENFSSKGRSHWDSTFKVFNIGYQASEESRPTEFSLSPETIQALSRIGGAISVTVYPPPIEFEATEELS